MCKLTQNLWKDYRINPEVGRGGPGNHTWLPVNTITTCLRRLWVFVYGGWLMICQSLPVCSQACCRPSEQINQHFLPWLMRREKHVDNRKWRETIKRRHHLRRCSEAQTLNRVAQKVSVMSLKSRWEPFRRHGVK